MDARIDVLHRLYHAGSASVRRHLRLPDGQEPPIYDFARAILTHGEPLAVNYSFVPADIGRVIEHLDLTTAKVFPHLESNGYNLGYGEQEITSSLCTAEFSSTLDYPVGQPVLVFRRTTYLESGYPIMYEKTVYRGDRYQYSIRLQRRL
jgi:GntR family transcriptional regulator